MREYWTNVSSNKKNIVLSPTIADAIASAGEGNERTSILKERLKSVSIENEYAKYEQKNKIHRILMQKFRDTNLFGKIDEIEKVFEKTSSKKIVYLDSLKKFGKREGLFVYNCIKDLVG